MRKIFLFSVLAVSFLAASCESEFDPTVLENGNADVQQPEQPEGEYITLSINAGPSEVELKSLFDNGGPAVKWGTGDIISVIDDEGGLHVSKPSESSAKTLEFVFEKWPAARKPVYAFHTGAYGENVPVDTYADGLINTSMESEQPITKAGRFARTPVIAIGDVVESEEGYSVSMSHAYGLVKLTIDTDKAYSAVKLEGCGENDALAGDVTLDPATKELKVVNGVKEVQIVNESGFAAGDYYICVLPGVLTTPKITLVALDGTEKTLQNGNNVPIAAGVITNFGTPEDVKPSVVDLSADGTANCYVIDGFGSYMFKAVKGNSNASVGTVASAEVLWEDRYNADPIVVGSIISAVSVKEDYICFTIPEDRIPGNALIAAKDAEGTILWSWHIWVCNKGKKPADIKLTNDLILMDRNIGSRQANNDETSMLYQWGRKDPFPGQYGAGHPTTHTGTITVKAKEGNDNNVARASISESIQNPTTLYGIYKSESATIWLETAGVIEEEVSATKTYLWGKTHTDKTIYDPCPVGYKVPHAWADPVNGIPSDKILANSRFAAFAELEATAEYSSSVRTYTVADGSELSFYATGWYLFGQDNLPELTYNTSTRGSYLWTASLQAAQYSVSIKVETSVGGISIKSDKSTWTKNNAFAVRCEKIQN